MSVRAFSTFLIAATKFGLSVNVLVADYGVVPGDCDNIAVRGLVVKDVSFIVFLGSVLTPNTRSSADIRRRLAQASSAFDYLREVLVDDKSSLVTRRQLYNACVPSVLLYRSERWTTLCSDLRHFGCVSPSTSRRHSKDIKEGEEVYLSHVGSASVSIR